MLQTVDISTHAADQLEEQHSEPRDDPLQRECIQPVGKQQKTEGHEGRNGEFEGIPESTGTGQRVGNVSSQADQVEPAAE